MNVYTWSNNYVIQTNVIEVLRSTILVLGRKNYSINIIEWNMEIMDSR